MLYEVITDEQIYILEVNPRASRTSPFVSKATGVPLAKLATRVMMGEKLADLKPWEMRKGGYYSVKEAVLPFNRFPGVDALLGPEMRVITSYSIHYTKLYEDFASTRLWHARRN